MQTKIDIIKHFGKPESVFEPNNECGFLSENVQGKKLYTLKYPHVQFTGNENDKYQLEKVEFNTRTDLKIFYKGKALSSQTTKEDFEAIFQIEVATDEAVLLHENADDSLIFRFINGLLSKMEYWSPC